MTLLLHNITNQTHLMDYTIIQNIQNDILLYLKTYYESSLINHIFKPNGALSRFVIGDTTIKRNKAIVGLENA